MEPRPQRPRQQPPRQPDAGQTPQQTPGPLPPGQPHSVVDQTGVFGGVPYDQGRYAAPPRTSYDYSPLDLVPPGQRRRRQLIAGIIGALSVLLVAALIVFGWMLLHGDSKDDDGETNLVAEATQSPASQPTQTANANAAKPTEAKATEAPRPTTAPTAAPTAPAQTAVVNSDALIAILPGSNTVPDGYVQGDDGTMDQATLIENIGGGRLAEQNIAKWGWTGNASRVFTNSAATAGSTEYLAVSLHGFKDAASAQSALVFFSDILVNGLSYTEVTSPGLGESSRMLMLTDADGRTTVQLYVTQGERLYKFSGSAVGADPTQSVVDFATETLRQP